MDNMLDRLCDMYGVLPHYYDIWGNLHFTSDAAKRALLAAMGVATGTEEEMAESLCAHERKIWVRPLPQVRVVRETSQPCRITISLPVSDEGFDYRWCLRRESGQEDRGDFVPASMEEAGRSHIDGRDYVRRVLVLDLTVEAGYHAFSIMRAEGSGLLAEMSFIVAPDKCYQPPAIHGDGRLWGFAAQLYGIRSKRNWGVGDFGDLHRMIEFCSEVGAGAALLNPLHALFPHAPEHASPYSPSSRVYLNPLYLDVERIDDFAECGEAQEMLDKPSFRDQLCLLRAADQVDYRGVAESKSKILESLYRHFRSKHLCRDSVSGKAFRDFQEERGESLRKLALFEALQEHFFAGDDSVWGWPEWPEAYRDQHSSEVAEFCEAHIDRVEYFEYLQWQAFKQMAAVGSRSRELDLGVGVMLDLAIGVAEGGAATWTRPELYALEASTGAPPDEINLHGQDWGLPPWIPHQLTEAAYVPFIELLRSNMRDAGALRIDHVMGLRRLFWVARGLPVAEGAYVMYPFEDLLGILALESQRNRCLVVGEDLGTVPDEVRHALQPMEVMSTRLLYFERWNDGSMKPPQEYPPNAMAAVTTHDLPTLAGFWQGLDIEVRTRLNLYPSDELRIRQQSSRSGDRIQLLAALEKEGLFNSGAGAHFTESPAMTPELAAAVYAYLARAPSRLLLVQMEDGFGVVEQPNVPGATESIYPCWRLKLPVDLEDWEGSGFLRKITQALRQARPL